MEKSEPQLLIDYVPESNISVNEKGVMRDKRTGRLLPGTKGLNKKGNPKQKSLKKELMRLFGDDGKMLAKKLAEIIFYDFEEDKKLHKDIKRRKYEGHHQLKAMEMALHYMVGKPSESLHIDQDVDLTVDTKMHKIAKLINDNKDKLRLIQGGATDVVTDR